MKTKTLLLAASVFSLLSSASAVVNVTVSGSEVTMEFEPGQTVPQAGNAFYTPESVYANDNQVILWDPGPSGAIYNPSGGFSFVTPFTEVANTLVQLDGSPVHPSLIIGGVFEDLSGTVAFLGTYGDGLATVGANTIAGGSITMDFGPTFDGLIVDKSYTALNSGSYDPGTTGGTAGLVAVPEPSTSAALAGLAVLGLGAHRRKRR